MTPALTRPGHAYVVVTPARNEEENIAHTIRSMVAQTMRPLAWVIVNDGSTDRTREIIEAAAAEHSWIQVRHRPDRGARRQGGGVVETFNEGFAVVRDLPWQFLVKFDADLSFEPNYFEACLARFDAEPALGIGGGTICGLRDGELRSERPNDVWFHVRGATKIYRRACWEGIGGLLVAAGWDTLDEMKANMLGWTTRTFPELKLRHHRHTGEADGKWRNWVKNGRANYIVGYHPAFMFVKCLRRLIEKPYGIAGVGLMTGYVGGFLKKVPQVPDADVRAYIRREQVKRLLLRPSLWR
jgi:biofilm PGA synthesis N-glycosyltransferase PgaC